MDYIEKARTITCDALCHYGHRKYSEIWQNKRAPVYCPICNEKLEINDEMYFVVNNTKLFPNCLVHAKCIIANSSVEGLVWLNFNKATEYMHQNYHEFKSKYRAWIR